MEEQCETVELVLSNRRFLYRLIARCFAEEADQRLVETLLSQHAWQEVVLVPPAEDIGLAFTQLRSLLHDLDGNAVDRIRCQFARAFLGPGTLPSSPWESVHVTGKNLLFQPHTLSVREAYRSSGFLPARYPSVADDHIALELDFLANLAEKACESYAAENKDQYRRRLRKHRNFLDEHLLVWIDEYRNELVANDPDGFYTALSTFTSAVAKRDRAILNELLD